MKRQATRKEPRTVRPRDLERATAELDREFVCDSFHPPASEASNRWRRARRVTGRGLDSKVISVSLELGLLESSDRLAKRLGVSRAGLIARGLRAVLAAVRSSHRPARTRTRIRV